MLRKLQRAAARLTSDVPASTQAAVPAPADTDEYDESDVSGDEYDESGDYYEVQPETDKRPRGLYAVGGRGYSASAPTQPEPQPEESGGFELPGFLKKAKQLAEDIKPLTKIEAAALREGTVMAFMRFWTYADEGITATNAQRVEAHIWREVDREETEIVVDMLIERGKKSAAAAQIVRGISNIWNYYAVGLILGPRFYKTFRFYATNGGFAL